MIIFLSKFHTKWKGTTDKKTIGIILILLCQGSLGDKIKGVFTMFHNSISDNVEKNRLVEMISLILSIGMELSNSVSLLVLII